jgi:16S rRNA (uracil1498-N3)-methyltransferase
MKELFRIITMQHLKRFFCQNIPSSGKITLDAEQSNHLKNTLRLEIDSQVEIFSNNKAYITKVASINNSGLVELTIISRQNKKSLLILPEITLACAIAKGSRMDWLIEKTAEMGLTRLIPLITERTIVRPEGLHKIERWRKLAITAAKQCGQNSILDIAPPISFNNLKDTIMTNS